MWLWGVFFSTHGHLQWSRLVHGKTAWEDRSHILGLCSATPELLLLEAKARYSSSVWIWTSRAETEGSRDTRAEAGTLVEIMLAHFCQGDPLCGTHRSRANVTLLFPEPSTGISVEFWVSRNDGGIVQTNCNDIKSQEASRVFFPFNVKRESSLNYKRDVVSFFFPH